VRNLILPGCRVSGGDQPAAPLARLTNLIGGFDSPRGRAGLVRLRCRYRGMPTTIDLIELNPTQYSALSTQYFVITVLSTSPPLTTEN
jgi:hypothetical protein